jgi:hypothetical protein
VPLGEPGLRKKHQVTVVSVKPEEQTSFTHAGMDTVLRCGSEIIAGAPGGRRTIRRTAMTVGCRSGRRAR